MCVHKTAVPWRLEEGTHKLDLQVLLNIGVRNELCPLQEQRVRSEKSLHLGEDLRVEASLDYM